MPPDFYIQVRVVMTIMRDCAHDHEPMDRIELSSAVYETAA